jgi:hypothetical protein
MISELKEITLVRGHRELRKKFLSKKSPRNGSRINKD